MKTTKISSFLLIAFFSFYTLSCSNDDPTKDPSDGGDGNTTGLKNGQIEIKVYPDENNKISFTATAKEITIDWGDGNIDELTPDNVEKEFIHEFSNQNLQTILITSNSIEKLGYEDTYKGKFQEFRFGETSLKELYLRDLQLTSLDISKCTDLTGLNCNYNQLTSLDVSKCTALTNLSCGSNQLTSLDVTKCTALIGLYCFSNQLTSLDVTKCTALISLSCISNQLISLDVSGCTALTDLYCASNQLTADALNTIFAALPFSSNYDSFISLSGNPRSSTCDRTIATEKGWLVHYY